MRAKRSAVGKTLHANAGKLYVTVEWPTVPAARFLSESSVCRGPSAGHNGCTCDRGAEIRVILSLPVSLCGCCGEDGSHVKAMRILCIAFLSFQRRRNHEEQTYADPGPVCTGSVHFGGVRDQKVRSEPYQRKSYAA